ncbi:MAG: diguanylate cyclase [candidate division Zixibacteria bacterium]|nr:diguanylate cyclase [candidate division Zixibacteria bacterium]
MIHCAIYQSNINIKSILKELLKPEQVTFHPFANFRQLLENRQRYEFDLVVLACQKRRIANELNLVRQIGNDLLFTLLPILFWTRHKTNSILTRCYQVGIDEVLGPDTPPDIASLKVKNLINRSSKNLGVNPSTKLPGVNLIEHEISKRTSRNEKFALCYADLDEFKAFNDYYGYFYGNRLIVITAGIIKDVVFDLTKQGFVGHIGGDDFIFIVPIEKIKPVCSGIIKVFDKTIPACYHEKDLRQGYIETVNRDGIVRKFPMITISIAVIKNTGATFSQIAEISHMLADLKRFAKTMSGSNYIIERRRKY